MPLLSRLFRRRRYDDLSVSIQEHIGERTEELMEEGMARKEAEQAARREFGNLALIEQRSREVWQWPLVESLFADLKLTLRRLRKSPGFAATVLLTLAIGIGANTAVFTVVDSVLIKPLPYPNSNRLAALWLNAPGADGLANFSAARPSVPGSCPWRLFLPAAVQTASNHMYHGVELTSFRAGQAPTPEGDNDRIAAVHRLCRHNGSVRSRARPERRSDRQGSSPHRAKRRRPRSFSLDVLRNR
ncbi:MAG: permease prefix domain 1-containing protein [Terracidiphilus sp.]